MDLPEAVVAFLREVPADLFCPLTPDAAATASEVMRRRYPLARELGLIVLNDANDSDPYCLVTRGAAAGAVMFVPHDDSPTLAFPSLDACATSLRQAAADGVELYELLPVPLDRLPDQPALAGDLRAILAGKDRDRAILVGLFLPLLDPEDTETLRLVATDRDFAIREAAALRMASAPRAAQVPALEALAVDTYPQVWKPARRALAALGVAGPPLSEEQAYETDTGERGATGLVISLVVRPNGKAWLVMDDLRRDGDAPPYTWSAEEYFAKDQIELAQLHELDDETLAGLGRLIVARLSLHHKNSGDLAGDA